MMARRYSALGATICGTGVDPGGQIPMWPSGGNSEAAGFGVSRRTPNYPSREGRKCHRKGESETPAVIRPGDAEILWTKKKNTASTHRIQHGV